MSRRSTGPRRCVEAPIFAAGPLSGPDGAPSVAGDHIVRSGELNEQELRALAGDAADLRLAALVRTVRAGRIGGRAGRLRSACSPTSRLSASSGKAPPVRSAARRRRRSPTLRSLLERSGSPAAAGASRAGARAGFTIAQRRAQRMLALYEADAAEHLASPGRQRRMKIAYFTHSLLSCWNHGNAHFLRGVLRELSAAGHEVVAFEPRRGWSLANLLRDHGEAGLGPVPRALIPNSPPSSFDDDDDLDGTAAPDATSSSCMNGTSPALVAAIGATAPAGRAVHVAVPRYPSSRRERSGRDPRASTSTAMTACWPSAQRSPRSIAAGAGATAFSSGTRPRIRAVPPAGRRRARDGLVWIGNWGDEERSEELEELPVAARRNARAASRHLRRTLSAHGARDAERYGARYRGWLAECAAPEVFARHLVTVHVPAPILCRGAAGHSDHPGVRGAGLRYSTACAPWSDAEGLFTPGEDYLMARDGDEMCVHMRATSSRCPAPTLPRWRRHCRRRSPSRADARSR